jgi:hypothetical protein
MPSRHTRKAVIPTARNYGRAATVLPTKMMDGSEHRDQFHDLSYTTKHYRRGKSTTIPTDISITSQSIT